MRSPQSSQATPDYDWLGNKAAEAASMRPPPRFRFSSAAGGGGAAGGAAAGILGRIDLRAGIFCCAAFDDVSGRIEEVVEVVGVEVETDPAAQRQTSNSDLNLCGLQPAGVARQARQQSHYPPP